VELAQEEINAAAANEVLPAMNDRRQMCFTPGRGYWVGGMVGVIAT
jgi:hypothetical protein